MKIGKQYVGKIVYIKWRDPCMIELEGELLIDNAKGWKDLPIWECWGKIDDITDGVVRLIHSICTNAVPKRDGHLVPDLLIEECEILERRDPTLAAPEVNQA